MNIWDAIRSVQSNHKRVFQCKHILVSWSSLVKDVIIEYHAGSITYYSVYADVIKDLENQHFSEVKAESEVE